ncbi:RRP15-like protein [Nephila pilipes]|uniref:RRP15-like protein n=1 Tax=Nephila pilipes TaxID=299642 RepID=A0A8X6TN11_NEPPI|nr:RRP15-like protein [Nephila pilipes]
MERKSIQTSENSDDENEVKSDVEELLGSEDDDKKMDAEESGNFADESSSSDSEGNVGWADAMSKVLHTSTKNPKFILSKAKKDVDVVPKVKQIELVDEAGQVIEEEPKKNKSRSDERKERLEKQRIKAEWEAMCYVKPDIKNKDRERELVKIATRGVVYLFNTVEKHQITVRKSKKKPGKPEKLSVVKGNFMDILKQYSKKDEETKEDPVAKKVKQEEAWSILRDDFMIGTEMKDWDKDDENT